jgi:hypothetical protein
MKNRLVLYFGLMLLAFLKILLCVGLITLLILFSPIFLFINKKSFYYSIDELYKTLK